MTKKELKQIEETKKQMRILRWKIVDAYTNCVGDLDAYDRVNRINGEQMTDEIKQKVIDRYPILKEYGYTFTSTDDIGDAVNEAIYQVVQTERRYKGYRNDLRLEKGLADNDVYYNVSFPSITKMVVFVRYAQLFGYERLVYTHSSIDTLTTLIEMGCKVVGTNRNDGDGGLILDITDTKFPLYLSHLAETEKAELVKHDAEWNRVTPQEKLDAIDNLYRTLNDFVK